MPSKDEIIKKLKQEIKQLKETCEIMSSPKTMKGIAKSLEQIKEGKTLPLEKLKTITNSTTKFLQEMEIRLAKSDARCRIYDKQLKSLKKRMEITTRELEKLI